jgi:hypothetical protein
MALAFPLVQITQENQANGNLLTLPDGGVVAKPLAHCVLVTLSKPTTFDAAAPAMEKPERQSKAAFDEFQFVDGPYMDDPAQTTQ